MNLVVSAPAAQRAAWSGVRVEIITVVWMLIEGAVAIGAGLAAHSLLLTAFGLDSGIELVAGGILLWRLRQQAQQRALEQVALAERRAAWVVAITLTLLCGYISASAALSVLTRHVPEISLPGLGIAALAVVGMPLLAWRKRQLARTLGSAALRGDAACSLTCAAMAATLFLGLALTARFHWWWADSLMSLAFLGFLVPEARAAWDGARQGRAACACGADDCDG
ncbi:MAG: cation transporter [Ktedonobacterales bacterium]|nr:cation transporter [Ktedonobacterales bacterium]